MTRRTSLLRLTVAYDGGGYAGWQRQPNAMTVQERLEDALGALVTAADPSAAGRQIVVGAGRTDAGVHARGQVAHVRAPAALPLRAWVHAVNSHLPSDIRVLAAHRMPESFHAQRSAVGKRYVYRLYRGRVPPPTLAPYAAGVSEQLDVPLVRRALADLPGRRDFSAFALAGGSHRHGVRRLFAATLDGAPDGRELTMSFYGEGFLRGMVRALVGTAIEIGRGQRDPQDFRRLLLPGTGREQAGFTAEARGLCLEKVFYPEALAPLDGYVA
ncbi:MAG: tRNA pseudouridine(38-40) synthase TruA [Acidobacteriota bacterium]